MKINNEKLNDFKLVNVVLHVKILKLFDSYVWDSLVISMSLESYYVRLYRNYIKMLVFKCF